MQGIERYNGKVILYSPGTFIGRQLPPESEGGEITDLVRSLLADMSPDGFITLVEIDGSGAYGVRLIPTSLDSHGLPVLAADDVLDRISGRVSEWSTKLDTPLQLSAGELRFP